MTAKEIAEKYFPERKDKASALELELLRWLESNLPYRVTPTIYSKKLVEVILKKEEPVKCHSCGGIPKHNCESSVCPYKFS